MAIKATIKGQDQVQRKLGQLRKKLGPQAFAAGMYAANVDIIRDAKRDAPVDSGTLRNSGYVTLPSDTSRGSVTEAGFGGKAAAYAPVVHERTEISHPKGKAKFFEGSIQANRRKSLRTIARAGRVALERGRGPKQAPGIPVDPFRGGG